MYRRYLPILRASLLCAALPALLAAKFPVDEEVFYPVALPQPSAVLTGTDEAAVADLLSHLNASSRVESPGLWDVHEEDKAGGRTEVMAAVTRTLMTSDRYCERRSTFETGICRIAHEDSLERAERALLRSQDGRFQFLPREVERIKLIFKRTKRALYEVIQADDRFSDEEKARIVSRIVDVEVSENSFLTDLSLIKNEAERAEIKSQCLDGQGRFLVDNSYLKNGKITFCPFHLAKAFATGDEGRPEEIMLINLAHLLAHSLDFDAFRKDPPKPYSKSMGCYASKFAGIDDTYGLKAPGTFRSDTEVLCCCATPAGDSGVRSCLDSKGCGAKGADSGCDIRDYMSELLADQWAYSTLGRYMKREQDYALGKIKKAPEFITKQNRDLFSKNMYLYCEPTLRREAHPEFDANHLFTDPKMAFRIAEARKNRILAKAISCSDDAESLQEEFGPVCWSPKVSFAGNDAKERDQDEKSEEARLKKIKKKKHRKKSGSRSS